MNATAFSKGSHERRVKELRFGADTAKLLARSFDGERRALDRSDLTIAEYLRLRDAGRIDLYDVPLFLSAQATPLTAKNYRDNYLRPACQAAGIDADARAPGTALVRDDVHARGLRNRRKEGEVARAKGGLIAYIGWRSGEQTLAAYEHSFKAARAAAIQDRVHAKMRGDLQEQFVRLEGEGARPLGHKPGVFNEPLQEREFIAIGSARR